MRLKNCILITDRDGSVLDLRPDDAFENSVVINHLYLPLEVLEAIKSAGVDLPWAEPAQQHQTAVSAG